MKKRILLFPLLFLMITIFSCKDKTKEQSKLEYSKYISGFTQGVQPIISYNYGAGKFHRVKRTYRSMIGICFAFSLVATLLTIFLHRGQPSRTHRKITENIPESRRDDISTER